jgi:hypothetical protein
MTKTSKPSGPSYGENPWSPDLLRHLALVDCLRGSGDQWSNSSV